jgi:hypothetical protein
LEGKTILVRTLLQARMADPTQARERWDDVPRRKYTSAIFGFGFGPIRRLSDDEDARRVSECFDAEKELELEERCGAGEEMKLDERRTFGSPAS